MTLPQQLSILQAALEGKRIDRQPLATNALWCEVTTPQTHHFAFNDYNYRLAPTTRKAREWWLACSNNGDCQYGVCIDSRCGWHAYATPAAIGDKAHPPIHVREVLEGEAASQRQTFEQWWQGLEPKCAGHLMSEHVYGLRQLSGGATSITYRNEALAVWRAAGGAE